MTDVVAELGSFRARRAEGLDLVIVEQRTPRGMLAEGEGDVHFREITREIEDPKRDFLYNFENIVYLDSAGIAEIASAIGRVKGHGKSVALCGVNDRRPGNMLRVTGLDKAAPLYSTEDEALAVYQANGNTFAP